MAGGFFLIDPVIKTQTQTIDLDWPIHPQTPTPRPDGRLALMMANRVDIFEYPGEELDPYFRWFVPIHKERHLTECGTLMAQVCCECEWA